MSQMNERSPQISIIMATHRDDGFLESSVSSILDQTDVELELILVANNCEDSLWQKIQSISQEMGDSRLRIFRTQIPQLTYNLNFGIDQARAAFIARMDGDDISLPGRLKAQYDFLISNPEVSVVGSQVQLIDQMGRIVGRRRLPHDHAQIVSKMKYANALCHPSVMFRKDHILHLGGYIGGFQSEDSNLWLRGVGSNKLRFHNLEQCLLQYRINPNSAQGSPLAYSEMVGHFAQLFVQYRSWYFFVGLLVALLKRIKKSF